MKFLKGMTCVAVIAASGVYLAGQYSAHMERKAAMNLAAIQLCLHERAKAASYRGSMAWAVPSATYKTGDEYCQ